MLISVTELTSQIIVGANFSFQLDIPQKLKEWSENFPREKILSDNETLESLQKELDKHCDIFSRQVPLQDQASSPEKNFMTAFEELIACINALLTNPELASATYADYNRLVENSCNPSGYNTFMPLCVLPTTKQGFLHYLRKFVAPDEKLEHLSKSELHELYLSFTPQKPLRYQAMKMHPLAPLYACIIRAWMSGATIVGVDNAQNAQLILYLSPSFT